MKCNASRMSSGDLRGTPVTSGELWWISVLPRLGLAAGALCHWILWTIKRNQIFYCFVASGIGLRCISPHANSVKDIDIFEIHTFHCCVASEIRRRRDFPIAYYSNMSKPSEFWCLAGSPREVWWTPVTFGFAAFGTDRVRLFIFKIMKNQKKSYVSRFCCLWDWPQVHFSLRKSC